MEVNLDKPATDNGPNLVNEMSLLVSDVVASSPNLEGYTIQKATDMPTKLGFEQITVIPNANADGSCPGVKENISVVNVIQGHGTTVSACFDLSTQAGRIGFTNCQIARPVEN